MFYGLKMAMEIADKNLRVLQFDAITTCLMDMQELFHQSMDVDSELYSFLGLSSSTDYREVLAEFSKDMLKHLPKEKELGKDCLTLKSSQYDTYLNAFFHMKLTNGYSMSQYLDAENPALGRFFEANLQRLDVLNKAFLLHLKANGLSSIMHQPVVPAMHR